MSAVTDNVILECDMGYGAVEVAPVSLPVVQPNEIAPTVNSNASAYVYIKDFSNNGSDESDSASFTINFSVSVYDSATGNSKSFIVPKQIVVSKSKLIADGQAIQNLTPSTVVEEVKKEYKKSAAQRIRELAGLPHSKNYV